MKHPWHTICLAALACILVLASCHHTSAYRWENRESGRVLTHENELLGTLTVTTTDGLSHSEKIQTIDSVTFCLTCTFKAQRDLDSARLQITFAHASASDFWMIPAVSYNGNNWGRGHEPKGAQENGQWRTISYRRTAIPGAIYSEGTQYAVATWSDTPQQEREAYACSVQPDESETRHCYIWPEEEMPSTYAGRDRFAPGWCKAVPLKKGETLTKTIYLCITPRLAEHAAMRGFLKRAWDMAPKVKPTIYSAEKLWELGIRYAKESLWTEDGDFRGFSIGLLPSDDGKWFQRRGGKYEIGWCGQNASYAISLLHDYLKNGSQESLEKGMATLDTWARCSLPNGLFTVRYDNPDGPIDACNLGVAAANFFEAHDVAAQCGFDRPGYDSLAYRICDFVMNDQQPDGGYAKGWHPNGESIYREGTTGCFVVPAMLEAYRRSGNKAYLTSAQRAYHYYLAGLKRDGFTTAGALDTWCIDKESSMALLRSAMRFHSLTGEPEYLEDALAVSNYLSTWLWHYDEKYPEDDDFTIYDYHTFGATAVSVQHNHLDPYALLWVADWVELSALTGDSQWREKAEAIWHNGNQLVSDGTLEINGRQRPAGAQNEAYFECQWGFQPGEEVHRINNWLVAWPGAFRLETLRRLPPDVKFE